MPSSRYRLEHLHISGAGTFVLATSGPLVLHSVNINSAGTLCTIYDHVDSSVSGQPVVAAINTTSARATNTYDCRLNYGLVVVTTGASTDLTIAWSASL